MGEWTSVLHGPIFVASALQPVWRNLSNISFSYLWPEINVVGDCFSLFIKMFVESHSLIDMHLVIEKKNVYFLTREKIKWTSVGGF